MTESMTMFISRYTRRILSEIKSADRKSESVPAALADESNMRSPIGLVQSRIPLNVIEIDMKVAESIGNGTRIFPDPDIGSACNWCVFHKSDVYANTKPVYTPVGTIVGSASTETFVDEAYRYVLMRQMDLVGRELYPALIENRQLSRRDFIKILADSEEAKNRGISVIVIPEPSSWLSRRTDGHMPSIVEKDTG